MVRSPVVRLLRGRSRGVVVLWIAFALMAGSCTGDSTEPGNGQTETTVEPGNTSSTTEPSSTADFIDPRRRQPDLDDPAELKAALLAMSITPQEANASLDYLAPEAPVAWAPGDAPGFFTDKYALEIGGPDSMAPGTMQGYNIGWEHSPLGGGPVSVFAIDMIRAGDPRAAADFIAARLEESEGPPNSTDRVDAAEGLRYVWEDFGSVYLFAADVVRDLVVTYTLIGDERTQVQQTADAAAAATRARIEAVLDGAYGYGPFEDVTQHSAAARWTVSEGQRGGPAITISGSYSAQSGQQCTITFGSDGSNTIELAFTPEGSGTAKFFDISLPTHITAWPYFGRCGRSRPGLPAYFSPAQNPTVVPYLRNVPDLASFPAADDVIAGIPTVRYDISTGYQEFLQRFSDRIDVDRFDIWLHAQEGWLVGWTAELSGDAAELEANGFAGGDDGTYFSEFRIDALDDDIAIDAAAPAEPLPANPANAVIAFTSERLGNTRDIYIRDPAGTIRLLTTHPDADEFPAVSPDGRTIAFTSRRTGNNSVFLIDADGANLRRLTVSEADVVIANVDGGDSWPTWSPDGQSIVFGTGRNCCVNDLWVVGVDGSDPRELYGSAGQDMWPAWSPDGGSIAFVSDMDGESFDVYTIRPDGSGLTRITDDPTRDYYRPAWSPDGQRLLVTGDEARGTAMYLMDPDGANTTQLTTNVAGGGMGTFTPDGEHIVFTGRGDLWSVRIDGSDLQQLTNHPTPDTAPSAGVLAD